MKVYNHITGGGRYPSGALEVSGYQSGSLALVTGDTLTKAMTDKQSWFAATTAAATDNIILDSDIEAGVKVVIVPSNGCEIAVETGGSANGGTDAQVIDIASGAIAVVLSLGSGDFIVHQIAANGALSAPTPAVDG